MFAFMLGLFCGWLIVRFYSPIKALLQRTEKKIEETLNETNR